jgi:hypothetical protein
MIDAGEKSTGADGVVDSLDQEPKVVRLADNFEDLLVTPDDTRHL